MAKHFMPRRGRASVLAARNPILMKGEIIFEVPDEGVGKGAVKVKQGDGVTAYNDLPYALTDTVVEEVSIEVETPVKEDGSAYETKAEYMGIIASNQKVKHIFGAIKKCLELTDNTLTELNNKIATDIINPYPVGSIYMSINNTDPSALFGGKWEKIEGRFLLGSNTTYKLGNIGGEAANAIQQAAGNYGAPPDQNWSGRILVGATQNAYYYRITNMPPYLVVNIWKRIE